MVSLKLFEPLKLRYCYGSYDSEILFQPPGMVIKTRCKEVGFKPDFNYLAPQLMNAGFLNHQQCLGVHVQAKQLMGDRLMHHRNNDWEDP